MGHESSHRPHPTKPLTVDNLTQAIFTVNRHAKTAINPKYLYLLKQRTIEKLLKEGKAEKVGLHFSRNPRFAKQQSDCLIRCGNYTFHVPPTKEDFQTLPHLGQLETSVRNPKSALNLSEAKVLLEKYTGMKEKTPTNGPRQGRRAPAYQRPVFKPLGERYE
ncbi:YkyB family protein [Bacillus fonticola]|uniref:YkyB family protein n=1 Tax=Bacillus fonticola TaxID=2728853 RepID=UPI0014745EC9|nr:YkyB family protein [Bacillus fonticola]